VIVSLLNNYKMDLFDVRFSVLLEFVPDSEVLHNWCQVSKSFYDILSSKNYWVKYFEKHNVPLPQGVTIFNYKAHQWLALFVKEDLNNICVNSLLKIINIDTFDSLHFSAEELSFTTALNVTGIDMTEITFIHNKYVIHKLLYPETDEVPICEFEKIEGKYYVTIYHIGPSLKYLIDEATLKQIFYNLLSHGVIPSDSNGQPIEFINVGCKCHNNNDHADEIEVLFEYNDSMDTEETEETEESEESEENESIEGFEGIDESGDKCKPI
jgi:hypothetical protein